MTAPILLPVGAWRLLMSWRTNLRTVANGAEQRSASTTAARMSVGGSFHLTDAQERSLRATLLGDPDAAVSVALPHEATPATAAVTGAAAVVSPTLCDWIANGRRVLIVGAAGASFDTTISSFTGGSLTLAAGPSSGTYPAGVTHVYPCATVLLGPGARVDRAPVNLSTWQIAGRTSEPVAFTGIGGAAVTTFDSLPVLVPRPLDRDGGEDYALGSMWRDAGGAVSQLSTWDAGKRRRAVEFMIATPAERQAWKVWLLAVRGMLRPFLAPTWRPDATLQAQPAGGATALRLAESLADLAPLADAGRVQVEYADGSVDYRIVSGVTDAGAYRSAAITAALPGSIPGGSVRTVSILETCRLDSDDVQIEYRGDWIGRIALPLVSV